MKKAFKDVKEWCEIGLFVTIAIVAAFIVVLGTMIENVIRNLFNLVSTWLTCYYVNPVVSYDDSVVYRMIEYVGCKIENLMDKE